MDRQINYVDLVENLNTMIGLLEFDSMRSAGKAKLNCKDLVALYSLKERYEAQMKPAPAKRTAAKKPAATK